MSVSGQVLAYLRVLAWPATVLVALVIFRVAISGLLGGIQELEGFGIKARIGRQLEDGIAAARTALEESPVGPAGHDQARPSAAARSGPGPGLPLLVISRAQAALAVSSRLAKPDPATGHDTPEAMRSYLSWLDTAVTAVVTVFATAEPPEPDQAAGGASADLTARGIERQLSEATGVSGWQGAIQSRDILRGTAVLVCGRGAAAVSQADARRFVAVVIRSLEHWQQLVKAAGEVPSPPVPDDGPRHLQGRRD